MVSSQIPLIGFTLETNFIADSAYTNLMIGCFEEVEEVVFESTGIGAA